MLSFLSLVTEVAKNPTFRMWFLQMRQGQLLGFFLLISILNFSRESVYLISSVAKLQTIGPQYLIEFDPFNTVFTCTMTKSKTTRIVVSCKQVAENSVWQVIMTEHGFFLNRILPYNDRIVDSRENKDQRKTVLWHILRTVLL